jgi:hypothetical protein
MATDTEIWERGSVENLVIFSKNVDFYDQALLFGAPPRSFTSPVVTVAILRFSMQGGVRRMDVFFSAYDRQEYLDLLSQSASKHALDFLAWCRMSHHTCLVVVRL